MIFKRINIKKYKMPQFQEKMEKTEEVMNCYEIYDLRQ